MYDNYWACPRCGFAHAVYTEGDKICEYCSTRMIETDINVLETASMPGKAMEEYIFEHAIKGNPSYDEEEAERTRQKMKREFAQASNKIVKQRSNIKCPNCGGSNVEPLSTTRKIGSVLTLGLASKTIGKSYRCKDCKFYW